MRRFLRSYVFSSLLQSWPVRIGAALYTGVTVLGAIFASGSPFLWLFLLGVGVIVLQAWTAYAQATSGPQLSIDMEVTRPCSVASPQSGHVLAPGRFVRVLVTNTGDPAEDLHCILDFRSVSGERLFDEDFQGRWSNTPQPAGAFTHIGGELLDISLPGNRRPEPVDVLVKLDEPRAEDGCYVWNNDSMLAGVRTDRFRIEAGEFDVTATLRGSDDVEVAGTWRIHARVVPQWRRLS